MAEEIKDLIEKIQQEGILAAEEKALKIEADARLKAKELIDKAKMDFEKIIAEAKNNSKKTEKDTQALLKQAARDFLLTLRKEVNDMLNRIIVTHVRQALSPEELIKIIDMLIKDYSACSSQNMTIVFKKDDLEKIEKFFLNELKEKTKKGIILKTSQDISSGFIISYDAGKSMYDFTDTAIASYIGEHLKPKLNELFKGL